MKTYIFHISLPGAGRLWRKIEIRADQTLEQLHFAIQGAFALHNDHLYSFFMSGKAWDRSTEYCLPEGQPPGFVPEKTVPNDKIIQFPKQKQKSEVSPAFEGILKELLGDIPNVVEVARERLGDMWPKIMQNVAEPGNVITTTIEELNLKQGQKFLYLFDYGSELRFKMRVHAIKTDAPDDADYPRIVERVGKMPNQYDD